MNYNTSTIETHLQIKSEIASYKFFMYISGSIALSTNLLAVYMILNRSPHQMKYYRWCLLNMIFWSTLLDVYLGIFYQPYLFFPAIMVCSQGILSYFRSIYFHIFLFQLHNWLLGAVGMSIVTAFLYRWATVVHLTSVMHKRKTLICIILGHVFFASPVGVMGLYAALYDPKAVQMDTEERFPVLYEFYQGKGCMVISIVVTPLATIGFTISAILIVVASSSFVTYLIYIIMYKIRKEKYLMSIRTYSMEKQLLLSLAIQFFVPTISIAIPFLLQSYLTMMKKVSDEVGMQIAALFFICATWHSTLNATCMILLTKPYRKSLLQLLFGCCYWESNTTVVFATETTIVGPGTNRSNGNKFKHKLLNFIR